MQKQFSRLTQLRSVRTFSCGHQASLPLVNKWTPRRDSRACLGRFPLLFPLPPLLRLNAQQIFEGINDKGLLKEDIYKLVKFLTKDKKATENISPRQIQLVTRKRAEELILTGISKKSSQKLAYQEYETGKLSHLLKEDDFYLHESRGPVKYGERECLAYLFGRMPHVYSSTARVLFELKSRFPKFKPSTVLDFGSGLGSTVWACKSMWSHDLYFDCIEISQNMMNLQTFLETSSATGVIPNVKQKKYSSLTSKETYDLTITAYTLSELSDREVFEKSLINLWSQTKGFLVLIEYGNKTGFQTITVARNILLRLSNAKLISPCPHSFSCPKIGEERTCFFVQNSEFPSKTVLNQKVKKKGVFREHFSFLIIEKREHSKISGSDEDETSDWSRIMNIPIVAKQKVLFDLCTPLGRLERIVVSARRGKKDFRQLRERAWGDLFPPDTFTIEDDINENNENNNNDSNNSFDTKHNNF